MPERPRLAKFIEVPLNIGAPGAALDGRPCNAFTAVYRKYLARVGPLLSDGHGPEIRHDRDQLLGIRRVRGITSLLNASGGDLSRRRRQYLAITIVLAD